MTTENTCTTPQEFLIQAKKLLAKAEVIREMKNADYSRGNVVDNNAAFKEMAKEVGITPLQVWSVFAKKHFKAIDSFIKFGSESEPIEGRIIDAINYLVILHSLIKEQEQNDSQKG